MSAILAKVLRSDDSQRIHGLLLIIIFIAIQVTTPTFVFGQSTTATAGNWSVAGNWSPSGVPTGATQVSVTKAMTLDAGFANAISLSNIWSIDEAVTDAATHALTFTNTGSLTIKSKVSKFAGNTSMSSGGSITVKNGATLILGGTLTMNTGSSITVEDGGRLVVLGNATITAGTITINGPSGIVSMVGTCSGAAAGTITGTGYLEVKGGVPTGVTVSISPSANSTNGKVTTKTIASGNWSSTANWDAGVPTGNNGLNAVVNHSMSLDAGLTSNLTMSDTWNINASVSESGTHSLETWNSTGAITLNNGGSFSINKINNLGSGAITVKSGGSFTVGANGVNITGNSAVITIDAGGSFTTNGSFTNKTNITANGNFTVNGNYSAPNASTSLSGTGTVTVTGSASCQNGSTLLGIGNLDCTTCGIINTTSLTAIATNQGGSTLCINNIVNLSYTGTPASGTVSSTNWFTRLNSNLYGAATNPYTVSSGSTNDIRYFEVKVTTTSPTATYFAVTSFTLNSTNAAATNPSNTITASPTTVCSGANVTLSVGSGTSGTFYIYDAATGGNLVATTTASSNVTVNPTVSTTYYLNYSAGSGCANNRTSSKSVAITVNAKPVAPAASDVVATSCGSKSFTLSASGSVGSYKWYTDASGSTSISGATNSTYTTPVLSSTTTYYVVSVDNSTLCESSPRTPVVAKILASPPILPSTSASSRCGAGVIILTVSGADNYNWYADATTPLVLATGSSFTTPSLSASTTYYVTSYSTSPACESVRYAVTATINTSYPSQPTTVTSPSICAGNAATFTASGGTGAINYNWYTSSSGGTSIYTGSSYTTGTLSSTADYYVSSINSVGCESSSRTQTTVTVTATPLVPTTTDHFQCSSNGARPTLSASGSTGNYRWYMDASTSTVSYTGSTWTGTSAPTATPQVWSTTSFYVTAITSGTPTCESARTPAIAVVQYNAGVPTAPTTISSSPGTSICYNTSISFSATGGNNISYYKWYDAATGGNLLYKTQNNAAADQYYVTPKITSSSTVYYVSSYNGCSGNTESNTRLATPALTLNAPPPTPTSASRCGAGTVQLSVAAGSGGTTNSFKWYTASSGGTGIAGSTYTSATLTPSTTAVTATYYVTAITTSPSCESSRVSVVATANPGPATPTISGTTAYCEGANFSLTANSTTSGVSYIWTLPSSAVGISGASTATISKTSIATTEVGTYSVVAGISGCNSSAATTVVTINPGTPVSVNIVANPGTSICIGKSVTFTASPVNGGTSPAYQWKLNGSNAGTGVTYTNSTLSSGDIVTAELTSNVACATNNPATSNALTMSVNSSNNEWLGTVSSNWHDAGNWCGSIPTSSTIVVINDVNNDPEISSSAAVKDITLNTSSKLTLLGTATLSVSGNWINNGGDLVANDGTVLFNGSAALSISGSNTFKNVIINNATGVSVSGTDNQQIRGALVLTNGVFTTNGKLVIDFTYGGNISPNGTGTISGNSVYQRTVSNTGFHYMSIPGAGGATNISDFNDDLPYMVGSFATYYLFDQSLVTTDRQKGWKTIKGGGAVVNELRGIAVNQKSAPITFDVTRQYNASDSYTTSMPFKTGATDTEVGYHLIGNPYPSTLDWDASGWTKTNINNAIYFYDPISGQIPTYNGVGTLGGSQYIAPMQSVFIQSKIGGGSLSVSKAARSTSNTAFFRQADLMMLRLTITSGVLKDETILRFEGAATSFFDGDFDAYKMMNGGLHPSLYTVSSGRKYAINTLSSVIETSEIALNLKVQKTDKYQINASDFGNIDPMISIYLEDKLTGEFRDLRADQLYEFDANENDAADRFVIYFQPQTITGTIGVTTSKVRIYPVEYGVETEFANNQSGVADISVYDFLGKLVLQSMEVNVRNGEYFMPLNTGTYIVKVETDNQVYTEKVVVVE